MLSLGRLNSRRLLARMLSDVPHFDPALNWGVTTAGGGGFTSGYSCGKRDGGNQQNRNNY